MIGFFIAAGAVLVMGSARSAIPKFHSAAAARVWGERQQQAHHYNRAAEAFLSEAQIRRAKGDPQGADVEEQRAQRLETSLALAIPGPVQRQSHLAKWEPTAGCYLGVQDGDGGRANEFQENTGRSLALVYEYSSYGSPFPMRWAKQQSAQGRAIQIAWEPDDITAVQDDDYLKGWAKEAGETKMPIFLRFGGEMNGAWTSWGRSPAAYRRAFRLVHDVMAQYAPNVAMVWAPNAIPIENLDEYFPGNDVVDWVGISLYVVRYYDNDLQRPAWQDNPMRLIAPFYKKYAARHPLCLVEWGVSRRSRAEGTDADPFAADRIEDLFAAIKVRFPRLKMVCAFDRNNLTGAKAGRRLNDFSLPPGSEALAAYREATAGPYFLSHVSSHASAPYVYHRLGNFLPQGYQGPLAVSLATYSLDPTLNVHGRGLSLQLIRPYAFLVPAGKGPLTLQVRDLEGNIAKTEVLDTSK